MIFKRSCFFSPFLVPRQDPIVKCKFLLLRHSDVNYHLLAILKSSTRDIFSHCLSLSVSLLVCLCFYLPFCSLYFLSLSCTLCLSLSLLLPLYFSPVSIIVNYHLSFLLFLFPDLIFFCSYLSLLFSLFVKLDPVKLDPVKLVRLL